MEMICSYLAQHVYQKRKIFVWGAWEPGKRLLAKLEQNGIFVDGFVDGNAEKSGGGRAILRKAGICAA